ncbi:precorrin-6A/cobalt-precorrin-6A reductase [Hathewaya proteolytica DSM 3090]|uniref:Precorrin-6A/cobalt-precorrin-6A reductase n=1 Tax=Hathewaya proteolytica DSM 3090 TaxID=1121331 RepID=A0A1M6Q3V6_9CLOT|nr:cobalt-precorrin-6A reductase [Hathewaya proteolytica]SHK14944.1 precorrin-6A/cobalt-precorrin-6A reductase [Hathewaya proteolytica DSM 3090]
MIGLILGTSEGKKILSLLNEFTDDIFVSTATEYGGQLLSNYKFKVLNTEPLDQEALVSVIKKHNIEVFVDGSHPYALIITENLKRACFITGIKYFRYERPSVIEEFKNHPNVRCIHDYSEIKEALKDIQGAILNTSGSRNIEKILKLNLKNNVIHRVLPTLKVMQELHALSIMPDNIHAIKGPISYDLNMAFIKDFNIKAMIMKDSGVQGGTKEKIRACINSGIRAIILVRDNEDSLNTFNSEEELCSHIKEL